VLLASIGSLFGSLVIAGPHLQSNGGDILTFSDSRDLGAGGLSLRPHMNLGPGRNRLRRPVNGTKFMIVRWTADFIAVADAYHIAIGKKAMTIQLTSLQCSFRVRTYLRRSSSASLTARLPATCSATVSIASLCSWAASSVAGWAMWLVRR